MLVDASEVEEGWNLGKKLGSMVGTALRKPLICCSLALIQVRATSLLFRGIIIIEIELDCIDAVRHPILLRTAS